MGNSCAVVPKVLNKKGEIVDSKLFLDLLSIPSLAREKAVEIYQITKSQSFIQNWLPRLDVDSNGEPTLKSLLDKAGLRNRINDDQIIDKLKRDLGVYKKGTTRYRLYLYNDEGYAKACKLARKFNLGSEYRDTYIAKTIKVPDSESNRVFFAVTIERKNKYNALEVEKMEYNESLNERLREILLSKGVSIGVLTELERRLGINGVTDFDIARTSAEGTLELIRLAEGIRGEKALPEEFAHFALEALGKDNPLVTRLLNLIISKNLTKEIIGEDYDAYYESYNGDRVKLAKEAAGKLLAKHLLQEAEIPNKPYKSLLQRLITSIKNFFRKFSGSEIQRAMRQADKAFGSLAKDILDGQLDEEIKVENISESSQFYNTSERVARDKKLLQSIIDNELKRLHIYEARTANANFTPNQEVLINKLTADLQSNQEIEGIYNFLENALERLDRLSTRISDLSSSSASINDKAKVYRDIRDYIKSYSHILEDIQEGLVQEEGEADNRYGERIRVAVDQTAALISRLNSMYKKGAMPLFVDFIKQFMGDSLVVPFGKWKGKVVKAEDIVKEAEKDISFFDRWLDSMADSSNYLLKVLDQAVKHSKEKARLLTIEDIKTIEAAGIRLEQAGVKNTDWMFERDSKGNLTGRYISEINYGLYEEARDEMLERLNQKYGKNPTGKAAEDYKAERRAWFEANRETVNGVSRPKLSIYKNKDYERMHSPSASAIDKAKLEYYNVAMKMKERLDSFLPENYTTLTNTVKIRRDLIERVKNADGVKSGLKAIWEDIKDQFIRRGDDTEFGTRAAVTDFENNEVQMLPIYYTKLRQGESNNDMSTDVTSTLIAYAAMANDFNQMNKVIDVLEMGRSLLNDNFRIARTEGNNALVDKAKVMGRTIEQKVFKSKQDSRVLQRLADFFEMQVYGRYIADEGTIAGTKIDKAKLVDFINRITALNSLAINVLSGISNVATGTVMMRIESMAREFFKEGDTVKADAIYAAAMPAFLAEIGNRVKVSKMALWDEKFNVLQDFEQEVRDVNFDRKTWASRMGSDSVFFTNHVGEHWMQNRTSLALANAYKMKDPKGNIVNLWDAMEVVYIDPNNKSLGARLEVKKGYTKADGSKFTEEDIYKFSRRCAALNQHMHGIYNKLDRNAFQKVAIGRMAMMFRKWIRPSYNKRWRDTSYNFDLGAWTEGYYLTTYRFLGQLVKDLRKGQFHIAANFKNLSDQEKANIRRACTEVGHLVLLIAILGLISWPDDKDRPWLIAMIEYQTRRLYTEVGALTPGTQMVNEGLRILKSPAAGINTFEDCMDLLGLMNPYNYETFGGEEAILQSGRYKGETKATKIFYESPIIPMNKTIYRGLHPEEGIPFFKQ